MTPSEHQRLTERISQAKWYHGWELLPGIYTTGQCKTNPQKLLTRFGLPENLSGTHCLDIGAWDGPYSFEMERRGAKVTAVDIQDPDATGFNLAKSILGSSCQYVRCNVYDLASALKSKYDYILFMGVYYHLKSPLLAFENIRKLMHRDSTMVFEGAILDYAYNMDVGIKAQWDQIQPSLHLPTSYFVSDKYAGVWSNWFLPTSICLKHWLQSTGFKVETFGTIEKSSRAYGTASLTESWNEHEHPLSKANGRADENIRH